MNEGMSIEELQLAILEIKAKKDEFQIARHRRKKEGGEEEKKKKKRRRRRKEEREE